MIGVELSIDGTPVVQGCMDRKLLVNCTHGTVIRLLPAMNLTEQQVHEGCDILAEVLQEAARAKRTAGFEASPNSHATPADRWPT